MAEIAVVTAAKVNTKNHLVWLAECIGSVRDQTFKDVVHVVVDDGSEIDLAERLRSLFPHVKFLRNEKSLGPGEARNLGVRSVDARYLFCLDSDDTLRIDGLEHLYKARCPVGYVYGNLFLFDEKGGEEKRLPDWSHEAVAAMTGPVGVTALQPIALWHRIGGWNHHLKGLEDIEYWIRAAEIGICGRHINKVVFNYRQRPDSRTKEIYSDTSIVRGIREQIKEKHRAFFGGSYMKCAMCPDGVSGPQDLSEPAPQGTVSLKYQGTRLAAFFTPFSPITRRSYRVEGRGAWVHVDPRDVGFLLQFNSGGRPDYIQTDKIQSQSTPTGRETYEALTTLPDVPHAFDLTTLSMKDAIEKVEAEESEENLRLWLAQELASDKQRTRLINAIRTRIIVMDGSSWAS